MPGGPVDAEAGVLDWLLEESDPSVRYFALRDLCDRPDDDAELAAAKAAIMTRGAVPKILDKQQPEGHWLKPEQFYTGKYRSTVWALLVLAELGADGNDPRIRKACNFILDVAQDRQSGGFSAYSGPEGAQRSAIIPCLTGNMTWVLMRFGLGGDPRVKEAIGWITTYQRFDDGDGNPKGWPYDHWKMCWGKHTCHMGVVKVMKALAEIPEAQRTPEVKEVIARAAEFMLIHHIYKRSRNLARASKPGWMHFGFPLMYQTDALEILNILLDLGYRDARMADAVDLVRSRQGEDGRWLLENTYNKSLVVKIEKKDEASKWITLGALKALKRYDVPVKKAA